MYHLVFASSKHNKVTNYWARSNRNINRGSTHNQFELETIRGSMKSRWELHGFGTRNFQTVLWRVEEYLGTEIPAPQCHKYMNGHIITVDTPVDMMWFRLNHENVSKNGCRMVEIYRDLDEDKVIEMGRLVSLRYDELNIRSRLHSYLNQSQSALNNFVGARDVKDDPSWFNRATKLSGDLTVFRDSHGDEIKRIKSEVTRQGKKLYEYIESCRTTIA